MVKITPINNRPIFITTKNIKISSWYFLYFTGKNSINIQEKSIQTVTSIEIKSKTLSKEFFSCNRLTIVIKSNVSNTRILL